jgi:hypothetical protein
VEDPPLESTREASQWTQPLQAAVAAFFVVSAVVNTVIVFGFADLNRLHLADIYRRSNIVTPDKVGPSVDAAMTFSVVITVLLAVLYLVLAYLSYFRRTPWVFITDMVVLFLVGAPNVGGGVLNLVSPSSASLPEVFGLTRLILALVALSLFILMLGLSWRYGMWAQRRVPTAVPE